MSNLMKREPVLVLLGGLAGVVDLGLLAAVALGWLDLGGEQVGAVVAFVTAACGLAAAVVRASVVSPATAEQRDAARRAEVVQLMRAREADLARVVPGRTDSTSTTTAAMIPRNSLGASAGHMDGGKW